MLWRSNLYRNRKEVEATRMLATPLPGPPIEFIIPSFLACMEIDSWLGNLVIARFTTRRSLSQVERSPHAPRDGRLHRNRSRQAGCRSTLIAPAMNTTSLRMNSTGCHGMAEARSQISWQTNEHASGYSRPRVAHPVRNSVIH